MFLRGAIREEEIEFDNYYLVSMITIFIDDSIVHYDCTTN